MPVLVGKALELLKLESEAERLEFIKTNSGVRV
jgi:hypothetical protein